MTERALLPQFIREALDEERPREAVARGDVSGGEAEPALGALLSLEAALTPEAEAAEGVEARAPSPALLERLEQTLSAPPHRYAPFFGRVSELFDLPESEVVALLSRLKDPNVWTFAGLPGISNVRVEAGPSVADAETLLVRFNPGVRVPLHRHTGLERALVLEGSYEDSNGVRHNAGELREWPPDTEHSFRVSDEGCIVASVVFGRRFSSWPLRALASVLGR